jgi:hypothetical protein
MKKVTFITFCLALTMICGTAQAQFGIGRAIQRSVERGAERAAEKKAEEAAAEATERALEKPVSEAERGINAGADAAARGINRASDAIERADSAAQADMEAAAASEVAMPAVSDTPYTPSAAEYGYFAAKVGAVQVVATKDAKGKTTSQTRNTITAITGSRSAYAIDYESELLDAKGKPTSKDNPIVLNYRVVVANGQLYLDLKGMFGTVESLASVEAHGSVPRIPNDLHVGQTIADANAAARVSFISYSASWTEGKCEAEEDVATEAGTFKALKVTQKVNSRVMGIRVDGTLNTWYVKGVGSVKTETVDKNGKVISSTELVSSTGL